MTNSQLENLKTRFYMLLESEVGNVKTLIVEGINCPTPNDKYKCTNQALYNIDGTLVFGYENATEGAIEAESVFGNQIQPLGFDSRTYRNQPFFQNNKKVDPNVLVSAQSLRSSASQVTNVKTQNQKDINANIEKNIKKSEEYIKNLPRYQTTARDETDPQIVKSLPKKQDPRLAAIEKEKYAVKDIGGELSTTQEVLPWLGMVLGFAAGIIGGPVGWAVLAAGLSVDTAVLKDLTQRTDNPYEIGLQAAFMILYLDDVRFLLKGSSFTEEALKGLMQTLRNSPMTDAIRNSPLFKHCMNLFTNNPWVRNAIGSSLQLLIGRTMKDRLINVVETQTIPYILLFLRRISPTNTKVGKFFWNNKLNIAIAGGTLVGMVVTFDQLYMAFNGLYFENEFTIEDTDDPTKKSKRYIEIMVDHYQKMLGDPKRTFEGQMGMEDLKTREDTKWYFEEQGEVDEKKKELAQREMNFFRSLLREYVTKTQVSEQIRQEILKLVMSDFTRNEELAELQKQEREILKQQPDFYNQLNLAASNLQSSIEKEVGTREYYKKEPGKRDYRDVEDRLQKIAENVYESLSSAGTDEDLLYAELRKLQNRVDFDLMNVYLYGKYNENFFDLVNAFLELELEEKKQIIAILTQRLIPVKVNENGKIMFA